MEFPRGNAGLVFAFIKAVYFQGGRGAKIEEKFFPTGE